MSLHFDWFVYFSNLQLFVYKKIIIIFISEGWSPALSVESVCLSIMSMLASAKEKVCFVSSLAAVCLQFSILFVYIFRNVLKVIKVTWDSVTKIPKKPGGGTMMITYKEKAVILVQNNFLVFDSEILNRIKHFFKIKTLIILSNPLHFITVLSIRFLQCNRICRNIFAKIHKPLILYCMWNHALLTSKPKFVDDL